MTDVTHEVFNQPEPLVGYNLFETHRPLQDALRFNAPGLDPAPLRELGALAGSADMQQHARLANVHTPRLRGHDRFGHRIDEVEFHPSYHVLMAAAAQAGLHGTPWAASVLPPRGTAGVGRAHAHVLRRRLHAVTELEPSNLCARLHDLRVTPALRRQRPCTGTGREADQPQLRPAPGAFTQKAGVSMGMGMNREAGRLGRAFQHHPRRARRQRRLGPPLSASPATSGSCRRPCATPFLVLADTGRGLSCLFMPRILPDGSRNALRLQRLKDKLGNKANASSEVEFQDAIGWLVGEEGRGVPRIPGDGHHDPARRALGTSA